MKAVLEFLNAVGGHLAAASGDPRETSFLWQHVSVLIQHFIAILMAKLFFIRTKQQTSSHSKHLFLVFDFSPLVLHTFGHKK